MKDKERESGIEAVIVERNGLGIAQVETESRIAEAGARMVDVRGHGLDPDDLRVTKFIGDCAGQHPRSRADVQVPSGRSQAGEADEQRGEACAPTPHPALVGLRVRESRHGAKSGPPSGPGRRRQRRRSARRRRWRGRRSSPPRGRQGRGGPGRRRGCRSAGFRHSDRPQ